ncbi:MAG: tRNA (guanosine(37)-N1)-methyltransferase TrmD, partial [Gardnerella vaginalis]
DLIEKLDCKSLSKQDRKTLISLGWEVSGDSPKRL